MRETLDLVISVMEVEGRTGEIVRVNDLCCKMLNRRSSDLVGKNVEDTVIAPWARESHRQYRKAFMINPRDRPMGRDIAITMLRWRTKEPEEFGVWIGLAVKLGEPNIITCAILPYQEEHPHPSTSGDPIEAREAETT